MGMRRSDVILFPMGYMGFGMKKEVYQQRPRKAFGWIHTRPPDPASAPAHRAEQENSSPEEMERALEEVRSRVSAQAKGDRRIPWISVVVAIPITLLILWMVYIEVDWLTGGKWGE